VSMLPPLTDPGALMKWWSSLYSDHANLSNGITFLHLAGLIVGGGAAVTTDRQILKAWRAGGDRRRAVLDDVSAVHVFVVGGLVLTIVTGALMMLADWDTFSRSKLFWIKMAGVGGPYSIALGPRCFTGLMQAMGHGGYPVLEVVKHVVDGEVVWAPGVDGAVVLSTRGGDFEMVVGRDLSIGYAGQDAQRVDLYLVESLTFRVLTPEAAVCLRYLGGAVSG